MSKDVCLTKNAGYISAPNILEKMSSMHYTHLHEGVSAGFGPAADQLCIHLRDEADDSFASGVLNNIALPVVDFSMLTITTNVGTYIVNDQYVVVPDGGEKKWVLISVLIDDTTMDLELAAFERLDSQIYSDVPAGKTLCAHLKEFSVEVGGVMLTQEKNYIR